MNQVLFDGAATQTNDNVKFSGGAEYAKFILKKSIENGYHFDVFFYEEMSIDPELLMLLEKNNFNIIMVKNKSDLYNLLRGGQYVKFYSALPYKYQDFDIYSVTFIIVMHGIRPIELPWDYYRFKYISGFLKRFIYYFISQFKFLQEIKRKRHIKNTSKLLSKKNIKIVTVSNHSKYSLLYFYPFLNKEDIHVFYSPFDFGIPPSGNYTKDYYLIISANRFEKNVYRTLLAFDSLISNGHLKEKRIVVLGSNKLMEKWISNKLKFEFHSYVSQETLDFFFKNAFCFVYPSLNEGFGYPPLVAMYNNIPVISSCSTSIPEVCENAVLYYNPYKIDEISNRILQIETDKELYNLFVERGNKRVNELITKQNNDLYKILSFIYDCN
ncbi:glycosyltransferase [Bacteroides sp. 519]|uniref:glycosyltransferase n=1 Tax=Bacteroides sp. 519 TaxID=2302937 RepID=UPI0013CFC32A|nr:glycosyltransferase [Bacteroides sp. 519]NDV60291.1 glycosyltransferase [Bacteroides sp. 519]